MWRARKNEMKRRMMAVLLIICVLFQMSGSYLAFPAMIWASDAVPRRVVRVTEQEIREALEEDDGSFELDEELIPFDAVHRADAKALVMEKLEDSVLVRQEKLGGNCAAIVAVKLSDEEAENDAESETDEASADSLVENVFMIGMNASTRACEFVLEIETDGGIVVKRLYVDEYISMAGGPGIDRSTSSDAEKNETNAASPSDAGKATPSDGSQDSAAVIAAGIATPSDLAGRRSTGTANAASPSNAQETDDETDDDEEEYEDVELENDLEEPDSEEENATPSNWSEDDAESDSPYGVFRENGTEVLEGAQLAGLVKQSGGSAGVFGMLTRLFSLDEKKEDEAPTFRVGGHGIVVLKTSRQGLQIPADILAKLAENRIYPGTGETLGDGSVVWTAYDGPSETDATTRVTVTFPAGTEIPEDYYLYLRRVNEEDTGYYPDEAIIEDAVGRYNDLQCWAIHWVQVKENAEGKWEYELQTDSVLKDEIYAKVEIQYLKEEAYLEGPKGERKLHVYNGRTFEGDVIKEVEDVGELTDVTATDDAYTGFTFKTNRGGPYIFINNWIYKGYVTSLTIDKTTDGTAPFDDNDEPGNDSKDDNKIIRSYDKISYDLTANFGARQNTIADRQAVLGYEITLEADITSAVFALENMRWMKDGYTIEYLDQAGKVVLKQKSDGKLTDESGKEVSLNDIAAGSGEGTGSYRTNIVSQRLYGTMPLEREDELLHANQTLSAAVQVLGAHQGSVIAPKFHVWFVGNEENYGSENQGAGDKVHPAEKVTENEKTAEEVTVSAAARFNLEIGKNNNMGRKGWFDFSTGKEVEAVNTDTYPVGGAVVTGAQLYNLLEGLAGLEENVEKANPEDFTDSGNVCGGLLNGQALADYKTVFQNIRYGRITGYGITLQIYNQAPEGQSLASKKFMGVSLPQGEVSFDLDLQNSGSSDPSQYYTRLWEYKENLNTPTGRLNRNMYWAELDSTKYASWAAPYNSGDPDNVSICYNGGKWYNDGSSYRFTIKDYDLNFLSGGLKFPTHKAGNGTATNGYNSYIGSFSAGYLQVLNVFPRRQDTTMNMETSITVKNLTLKTVDGQKVQKGEEDESGIAHESNTKDNSLRDSIPLYQPGGMTKANAFGTAQLFKDRDGDFTGKDATGKKYFLGTDFWGTSYDCSAFAGQKVTLVGAARINAGDYQIRHMNLLQLFDSEALSVDERETPYVISRVKNAVTGDQRILYAADPDYPDGYDTQNENVMHYMSTVREEDLIYYENMEELKAAGYTCIGVMAELRNCEINAESGYQTVLKILMNVSEEQKFLGKTVGTVNAVRIWTNAEDMEDGKVSWKDGVYDTTTGKNSVAGYSPMSGSSETHYCGQVANGTPYEKTEYENGQVLLGTNTGGYVYGSSLLILSYKSKVNIGVDNGGNPDSPTYDLDKGDYTVNYRLKGIIAERDETNGNAQDTTTDLTVLAKLDSTWKGEAQRIAVAAGGYCMVPAFKNMLLTDETGEPLAKQFAEISTDPENPTTVYYGFLDEETQEVDKSKIYQIEIYAKRDTNGKQVTFELAGATIGVSVPDITYDAYIAPEAVENNSVIQTDAYISGTSDVRAYRDTEGNMDSASISIIRLMSSRLMKVVDSHYIELDDKITYTVTYTNSGQDPVDVYFYDLKPNPEDERGSEYQGQLILGEITAELNKGEFSDEKLNFYYSTLPYEDLYELVSGFGNETGKDLTPEEAKELAAKLEDMLSNSENFSPLGKISSETGWQFQLDSNFDEAKRAEITGVYATVKNLGGNKALSVRLPGSTKGNRAGNRYRNVADSWLGDSSKPLVSPVVETSVLSRTISGVVWHDRDLNGVRDSGEERISGVICTLFKWNDSEYVPVKWSEGPNGREIETNSRGTYTTGRGGDPEPQNDETVTSVTGDDGTYHFSNLTAGEYIVAFSGEVLKNYNGATIHQVNGGNDGTTNDAVALIDTVSPLDTNAVIDGISEEGYSYAIAFDVNENGDAVKAVSMHTIIKIIEDSIPLTNDVELYANLDFGLVNAFPEMPYTGGSGTYPYRTGGMLLIAVTFLLGVAKRRREAEE